MPPWHLPSEHAPSGHSLSQSVPLLAPPTHLPLPYLQMPPRHSRSVKQAFLSFGPPWHLPGEHWPAPHLSLQALPSFRPPTQRPFSLMSHVPPGQLAATLQPLSSFAPLSQMPANCEQVP